MIIIMITTVTSVGLLNQQIILESEIKKKKIEIQNLQNF